MSDYEVRPATQRDAKAIAEVHAAAARAAYEGILPDDQLRALAPATREAKWRAARDGLEEEGCTKVTIWVPLRNDRAMRFHELAGFKREMKTAKTTAIGDVKIEEIRLKRDV